MGFVVQTAMLESPKPPSHKLRKIEPLFPQGNHDDSNQGGDSRLNFHLLLNAQKAHDFATLQQGSPIPRRIAERTVVPTR